MGKIIQQPFKEIESTSYFDLIKQEIRKEINSNSKEYILGVDFDKYCDYLVAKYTTEPVTIDKDSAQPILTEEREKEGYDDMYMHRQMYKEYKFDIQIQFRGDSNIFRIYPSQGYTMTIGAYNPSPIRLLNDQILSISLVIYKQDTEEFIRAKDGVINVTFKNLENVNKEVGNFNAQLPQIIRQILQDIRTQINTKDAFLASINAVSNIKAIKTYEVPIIENKIIAPTCDSSGKPSPILVEQNYRQILTIIDQIYKKYEQLPNVYKNKDEEALRDSILPSLQTHFTNCTATGETFNKNGKTDICIKHTDGSNVFIGECKIWKGEKLIQDAINQLVDSYVTWRDTKVALIVFVQNDNFTEVIQKAKLAMKHHPYYVRTISETQYETRGSYIFRHSEDEQRSIV